MQEKKVTHSIADGFRGNLHRLFLYCVFTSPEHICADIVNHLAINEENIKLIYERNKVDEEGVEVCKYYTLLLFDCEYVLRFDRRVDKPKEIEVPKVVNLPKKWWQKEPNKTIIKEKVMSSEKPTVRWLLSSID
jgi:hypothetical protein